MDTPLNESIRIETFEAIAQEVNGRLGGQDFAFWVDKKNLRAGDQWRTHLHAVLADCDFLVVLVSPAFLRSDVCHEEFDTFRGRFSDTGCDGRIIPILLRDIPEGSRRISKPQYAFRDRLKAYQRRDWRALADLDTEARTHEFRGTAADIADQIHRFDADDPPPPAAPPAPRRQTSVDASTIDVASGYYLRPGQNKRTVLANIGFSGPAHVHHGDRRVVFSVDYAVLQTQVTGGQITDENRQFGADGWAGPVAHVTRVSPNLYWQTLKIESRGTGLQGEVLCGRGDQGLVPLFSLEVADGAPEPSIHGVLRIQPEALVQEGDDSDGTSNREVMKAELAAILIEKLGLAEIPITEPDND